MEESILDSKFAIYIEIVDYQSKFIKTFPAVFPGVRHFEWNRRRSAANLKFDTSLFKVYIRRNWTKIETIIDHTYYLDLSTHLLGTATCEQLTSINISFKNYNSSEESAREKMKALISTIHNAPALEKVVFRHMAIRVADVENLHQGAPNLTTVELDNIYTNREDTRALIVSNSAKKIKSFSILVLEIEERAEEMTEDEEER